ENQQLKDQNLEEKIQKLTEKIYLLKIEYRDLINHDNLDKFAILIDKSLDNFKISYNDDDLLKYKIDFLIEFTKIEELKKKPQETEDLKKEIADLKDKNNKLTTQVNNLTRENNDLKDKNNKLTTQVNDLTKENNDLKKKNNKL
ncbi:9961_t:CDS:2, partial [Cetraspora pellucida]